MSALYKSIYIHSTFLMDFCGIVFACGNFSSCNITSLWRFLFTFYPPAQNYIILLKFVIIGSTCVSSQTNRCLQSSYFESRYFCFESRHDVDTLIWGRNRSFIGL